MQVSQAGSHLWYRKNTSYRHAPPGKSASAPGKHRPEAGPFHLSCGPGHARTKHRGLNRRLDARHSKSHSTLLLRGHGELRYMSFRLGSSSFNRESTLVMPDGAVSDLALFRKVRPSRLPP